MGEMLKQPQADTISRDLTFWFWLKLMLRVRSGFWVEVGVEVDVEVEAEVEAAVAVEGRTDTGWVVLMSRQVWRWGSPV